MQNASGRIELVSRRRNRNLSIGDHSLHRFTAENDDDTGKPANATAICAAVLRASAGSIII